MLARNDELVSLFLRLAPIEGLPHAERAVADEVTQILRKGGIRVVEDGAAALVKGNTGNLFCFPPSFDERAPAIVLEAHLDTVQSTARLKAIVSDDRISSDGTTILGADNRMGLSILVDLLLNVAKSGGKCRNFFVLFTVCEETGLCGAAAVDLSAHKIDAVYVFDCSKRPGIYIREAVGLHAFTAEFIGKAAHAGVAPEDGISAIAMAASAISKVPLGRVDAETTANIGKIRGGEAVNIVPDKVVIEGEVRSFSREGIKSQLDLMKRAFRESAGDESRLVFTSVSEFEPYIHAQDATAVVHLKRALSAAGLTPQPIRYMGGSDANIYNAKGIPAVNVGIGAQKPHSTDEFFLLEDLDSASAIARELVRPQKE
jgi:tripeptide aminopeptidase